MAQEELQLNREEVLALLTEAVAAKYGKTYSEVSTNLKARATGYRIVSVDAEFVGVTFRKPLE